MNDGLFQNGYAPIGGLRMYYEIYGEGDQPLVTIHGGGSAIQTSFGSIIPYLSRNRQVIAMELQAHGRTGDRDTPLSFQQDADDIAALMRYLNIEKADFLGFSNGGQTLLEFAMRYPELIRYIIICSAFYKKEAVPQAFWDGFENARLEMMPEVLREGFLSVNNNSEALQNSFNRDVQRMREFKGWTDKQISSIKSRALVVNANKDVGSLEHVIEMYRTLPEAELVVLPGMHGEYLEAKGALEEHPWPGTAFLDIVETFLNS